MYLAFDLGAASGRAVLGSLDGATLHLEELHRFETPLVEAGGHLYWDLDGLWEEIRLGFANALQAAPGLRSLSVDAWGVDYVALDVSGVPLRRPYCYRDPRTNAIMERAFETVPAAEIYAQTGIQFLPINTLYQLLADRREDAGAMRRVHRYLPIADYFNHRFGGRAVVEVSSASTTQLMSVATMQWAGGLFEAFGLEARRWPPIVPSGSRLGPVRDTPHVEVIASCSHDTGCAVAAIPCTSPASDWAFISCGTWSLLGMERTTPLLTTAAREAGFTHEAGADNTIRFLKNLTGLWTLQECAREWGVADWSALEDEARNAPPPLTTVDLEDARFLARGDMVTRLRESCREHAHPVPETRGQLVRLVLESIAASYQHALRDLQRVTGETVGTIHLVGGGSRNRLLCQLAADACRVPVVAGPAEATAFGNLLLQARTLGDLPSGVTLREVAARSSALTVYPPTLRPA